MLEVQAPAVTVPAAVPSFSLFAAPAFTVSTSAGIDEAKAPVSVTEPATVLMTENECEVSAEPKVTEPVAAEPPVQSVLV